MSLTQFAVKYRPVTYVALCALLGLGILALFTLSRREDPDLQGRFVQVIALYPGADAEQVEELVSDRLERSLLELDDTKTVRSTSRPGIAVLQAEASDQLHNMKKFRDELRNRIEDARIALPQGGRILRRNHLRTLTVSAYFDGSRLASQVLEDARKELDRLPLAQGTALGYGGSRRRSASRSRSCC